MDKYVLSRIFFDAYNDILEARQIEKKNIPFNDYDKLEKILDDYILLVAGLHIRNNKEQFYSEIKNYIENIFLNSPRLDFNYLLNFVMVYGKKFIDDIDDHPYTKLLIEALKKVYSINPNNVVISHHNKSYYIGNIFRKQETYIPLAYIENIDVLEKTLNNFINEIKNGNTYFNHPFQSFNNNQDAIIFIFEWVVKNASAIGLSNLNFYFKKYTSFINDTTFTTLQKVQFMGNFYNDELYGMCKRSEVNYETPYYFSFMLRNHFYELPNIRFGIEQRDKKIAHILAIQSAQREHDETYELEFQKYIKENIPKSKNFRQFNPNHLISLILALGIFNGVGIKDIEAPDYFPLRYQRFVLENRMNYEELDSFQHRLTNMMLNTYLKITEYTDDFQVFNYPETGYPVSFITNDKCHFNNSFLQNIYDMGYNCSQKLDENNKKKNKLKTN